MNFQVKQYTLPHEGVIPGARGHKKIVVPKGTRVYCIVHGSLVFWAAYLKEDSAAVVAKSLEATTKPTARRHIALDTLLAWNFRRDIPKRIHREKESRS